jgi:hypothetical protein
MSAILLRAGMASARSLVKAKTDPSADELPTML